MKKKIAIIGTVGVPACYGGFETLAEHLIEENAQTHDITVYCSGKKYSKDERKRSYKNARLVYLPFDANGVQSILYDAWSIIHALFFADVLLVLGVAGAWTFPFIRLFTNKKIIVSIDGIEWKRGKWNKLAKLYLWWAESLAVKYSHIDISDNESIQDYTAIRYGTLSKIIEYGADHTSHVPMEKSDIRIHPFLAQAYAFKVCRIEPENNVHSILEAFAQLAGYPLVIVGNWKNSQYGKDLFEKYSGHTNLHLLDPIYDQKKLDVLRSNCFLYIHGHSAGGTNPSLVEAMYLGLPVLAYQVSYNRTTTDNKALYFSNMAEIVDIVKSTKLKTFQEVGKKMKEIAHKRYTWKTISNKYNYLIDKALQADKKQNIQSRISKLDKAKLTTLGINHLSNPNLFYEIR